MAGNAIGVIENLAATQDQFDSIDLSDNEIRKVECMAVLKRLKQLLLCNNRVTRISESLGKALPKLETLVLTNNELRDLAHLEPLRHAPSIVSLSLIDNPVTKAPDYRAYVIALLPRLRVLDFRRVKLAERDAAEAKYKPKLSGLGHVANGAGGPMRNGKAAAGGERLAIESEGAGAAAAAAASAGGVGGVAPPTPEQKAQIELAVTAAESLEEVQQIEAAVKSGNYAFIAKAAEKAKLQEGQ